MEALATAIATMVCGALGFGFIWAVIQVGLAITDAS